VEVEWPGPSFPSVSSAVPRTELDDRIRMVAADEGAKMLLGVKAVDVRHDSAGRASSLLLDSGAEIGCSSLIVADGARSPLGRVLGRQWHQETVYGVAIRGYIATPRSNEPWITSHLELRSPQGKVLPTHRCGARNGVFPGSPAPDGRPCCRWAVRCPGWPGRTGC
jgi:flavin-dependent dehydrogenase